MPISSTSANTSEQDSGSQWYAVQTLPHNETRAIANLERQGFEVFCPCLRKTVRHARKVSKKFAPLFPTYVFVRFDVHRHRWRSVNGTYGVARLIAQGDAPQHIPRGIVEALQARVMDGAVTWQSMLAVGQTVRIIDGPFTEFVGTLQHLDSAGRVRVLLSLLGRQVSVVLSNEALRPAA